MKLRLHIIYIVAILLSACSTQLVIKSKQNSIVSVSASPDSLITSIIEPYKIGIDSVMNEVLCVSEIEMTKGRPESLLGNFVTDLCLDQYSYLADICIMNNGGLRSTLPQGEITRGKIYELMPFENELVILELNTLELFDLIEYIFVREGEPFSGLSVYSIDSCMVLSSRNILYRQEDNILMSVPVIASSCGGEEEVYIVSKIKETYKIRVLTSDYLANGGDKMSFFNNKKQLKVGLKIRDAIINYCKSEQTISSKLDGRITKYQNE
ncbi:MAG: hypothetical protein HOO15_00295 [Flavobacteriales bacterium]|nr:hypothetical protein [Flavobacteriales bacterium]